MNNKEFLHHEELHHDAVAESYSLRRETDFIWEVPEKMFLLRKKYFRSQSVIVDMGCGPSTPIRNSFSSKWLSRINYIGVDISKKMLTIARHNIPSGTFKQGDVQTISLPSNSADIILSLGTLHHALNKKITLLHWKKILKSGGYMLLREPTYESLKHGEGESPHEEGLKMQEIKVFILENKLKIKKIIYFNTKFFHLINRIMIKFGWKTWEGFPLFGQIIIICDVVLDKMFGNVLPFFRGSDVIMVIEKL